MEHPAPIQSDPILSAARRLLATDPEAWSAEDLGASEAAQREMIREGFPMLEVRRLHNRHRAAAQMMLRAEVSPAALVRVAERLIGRTATAAEVVQATDRINRAIRLAGGAQCA